MLKRGKKEEKQKSVLEEEQMQSPFRTIIKNLCENKIAMGSALVFITVLHPANLVEAGYEFSGSDTEKYCTGIFIS